MSQESRTWEEFRGGNEAAFSRLYDQHVRALLAYGHRLTSDRALVEDCLHDLLIDLWERRAFLGVTTSVRLYLFKSLKHKLLKALDQRRRRPMSHPTNLDDYAFSFARCPESLLIESQGNEARETHLHRSLAQLPPAQREAVYLRFFEGMAYEEIAELLAINYQSVNNLVYRAMKSLRKAMANAVLGLVWVVAGHLG